MVRVFANVSGDLGSIPGQATMLYRHPQHHNDTIIKQTQE